MNRLHLAPLALALALAACGPSVSLTNASADDVNKAVEDLGKKKVNIHLKGGQWQMKAQLLDMKGDGMTPEKVAEMKAQPQEDSSCLTADIAKHPVTDLFAPAPKDCRYTKFKMSNGKMNAEISCKSPMGEMKLTTIINYTETTINGTSETVVDGPMGKMNRKVKISGKRTGECKPEPKMPPGLEGLEGMPTDGNTVEAIPVPEAEPKAAPSAAPKKK